MKNPCVQWKISSICNFGRFYFYDLGIILEVLVFFDKFLNFFRISNRGHIFLSKSVKSFQILKNQGFLESSYVALSVKTNLDNKWCLYTGLNSW